MEYKEETPPAGRVSSFYLKAGINFRIKNPGK